MAYTGKVRNCQNRIDPPNPKVDMHDMTSFPIWLHLLGRVQVTLYVTVVGPFVDWLVGLVVGNAFVNKSVN